MAVVPTTRISDTVFCGSNRLVFGHRTPPNVSVIHFAKSDRSLRETVVSWLNHGSTEPHSFTVDVDSTESIEALIVAMKLSC